jgi:ligand-binding sensor domain-containing protein
MQGNAVRRAAAISLAAVVALVGLVIWRASRVLHSAADEVQAEHQIHFAVRPLPQVLDSDFEIISSPATYVQAARFEEHLYLAGPTGLAEYDPSGTLLRLYAVGRELPASPVVGLVTTTLTGSSQLELVIETSRDGLIAFNGHSFRQILPSDPDVRTITSILPVASGHLLIGTQKRGILVFDGKAMSPLHTTLTNVYVTALAGTESDLWVGTLNRGVLHFHAGATDGFSESEGLPDPQVHSLTVAGNSTFVGTSVGVAQFTGGQFSRVIAPGMFATSLLVSQNKLFVGTEDQGVVTVALSERHAKPYTAPASQLSQVRQLFTSGDSVFALARGGVFRLDPHAFGWKQALQPGAGLLSDRNVSALAIDANNRLWVGYFDHGLDIVQAGNPLVKHVEDEHVFCVNRIFADARSGVINVATANGLVRFDRAGSEQQVLTRAEGLIADHVTDVALYRDGLALATPAGLTFLDASGASSLYAFNGMVNNHLYALGVSGDQLLAGTLGGISVLDRGSVTSNYTTATSNLKHNWITAVVPVGDEWMVGTYGAGILGLDHSGHFHSYDTGSAPFEVNPNAMLVTANFVLAGTLGKGLYLFDRASERWSVIEEGLPSANVTALAVGNGYIYIGTDNGLVRIPEQKLHS